MPDPARISKYIMFNFKLMWHSVHNMFCPCHQPLGAGGSRSHATYLADDTSRSAPATARGPESMLHQASDPDFPHPNKRSRGPTLPTFPTLGLLAVDPPAIARERQGASASLAISPAPISPLMLPGMSSADLIQLLQPIESPTGRIESPQLLDMGSVNPDFLACLQEFQKDVATTTGAQPFYPPGTTDDYSSAGQEPQRLSEG